MSWSIPDTKAVTFVSILTSSAGLDISFSRESKSDIAALCGEYQMLTPPGTTKIILYYNPGPTSTNRAQNDGHFSFLSSLEMSAKQPTTAVG